MSETGGVYMARPSRCRRICFEPKYGGFAPCGIKNPTQVVLTVDEFEAIRLIDCEKKTHEQCGQLMNISRTTVTEIYERAREKIADCIVNGKELRIVGGNYALCNGSAMKYCGKRCNNAKFSAQNQADIRKETEIMKIAVTYENGNVFPHFGHTEQFKIYDIDKDKITASNVVSTNGSGHGALAGLLSSLNVDTLICGGIGAGAQNALAQAGIKLYGGVSGSADDAVNALLTGTLAYNPNVRCNHHGHEHHGEGHHCGEGHNCGEGHSCREGHNCG